MSSENFNCREKGNLIGEKYQFSTVAHYELAFWMVNISLWDKVLLIGTSTIDAVDFNGAVDYFYNSFFFNALYLY